MIHSNVHISYSGDSDNICYIFLLNFSFSNLFKNHKNSIRSLSNRIKNMSKLQTISIVTLTNFIATRFKETKKIEINLNINNFR